MLVKKVVSLPTGAGKTILAVMLLSQKSHVLLLVIVPTIDLLKQVEIIFRKLFSNVRLVH